VTVRRKSFSGISFSVFAPSWREKQIKELKYYACL
jgi:hypothetical protein